MSEKFQTYCKREIAAAMRYEKHDDIAIAMVLGNLDKPPQPTFEEKYVETVKLSDGILEYRMIEEQASLIRSFVEEQIGKLRDELSRELGMIRKEFNNK